MILFCSSCNSSGINKAESEDSAKVTYIGMSIDDIEARSNSNKSYYPHKYQP
jgi:hypothetical protein